MYFKQFYILLLSLTTISARSCGNADKIGSFVINGTAAKRGAWPWLASIHERSTHDYFCGGTIITDDTVLTAAHCIHKKYERKGRAPSDVLIKLGRYDLSHKYEVGGVDAEALDIFIHPDWNVASPVYDGDIAIVRLNSPVMFNDVIKPVCMWHAIDSPPVDHGYIVGYGRSENRFFEYIPRELDIKIIPKIDCFFKSPILKNAVSHSDYTFCAGNENQAAPCEGDSGTGMYIKIDDVWYLRGIVSAGHVNAETCNTTSDTIYTNVLKFRNWIYEKAPNAVPDKSLIHEKEVVCNFASFAIYRKEGGKFSIENIKPELCTTVVYQFAGIDDDGMLKSLDPWKDFEYNNGMGGFKRVTSLKKKNPQLRVLLSVGGWNEGVKKYSQLAASNAKRKEFAKQSADFLKANDFDGLNFHWDYPGDTERGGKPADRDNYPKLLKEIYQTYRLQNLYLSATIRADDFRAKKLYNLEEIAKNVDAINMMTFDYAAAWDKHIGYPAALRTEAENNHIEASVELFIKSKVPKNKLIIGIPFFARTFRTAREGKIGDPSEPEAFLSPIEESKVQAGYNELCLMKYQKSWIYNYHEEAAQMTSKFIENGMFNVAIHDTPRSVANKVKYAMENGLLGVWAWSIDNDDFEGNCPIDETVYDDFEDDKPALPTEKDFPLLRTMNDVIKFLK